MKSTITVLLTLVALACSAAPAFAMPADNGPPAAGRTTPAGPAPAEPTGGLGTAVYILMGAGAAVALGTGGYFGARAIHGRRIRLHHG